MLGPFRTETGSDSLQVAQEVAILSGVLPWAHRPSLEKILCDNKAAGWGTAVMTRTFAPADPTVSPDPSAGVHPCPRQECVSSKRTVVISLDIQ